MESPKINITKLIKTTLHHLMTVADINMHGSILIALLSFNTHRENVYMPSHEMQFHANYYKFRTIVRNR